MMAVISEPIGPMMLGQFHDKRRAEHKSRSDNNINMYIKILLRALVDLS
jgi:hypothetical protein